MRHSGIRSLFALLAFVVLFAAVAGLGAKDSRDHRGGTGSGNDADWEVVADDSTRVASASGRIINGKVVDDATFSSRYPGLVALQDSRRGTTQYSQFGCGGTLVSTTKVLTAAHCMDGVPIASLKVLAGTPSLDQTSRTVTQLVAAQSVVVHPLWNKLDVSKGNDLAVITLATPVVVSATAAPMSVVGAGEDNVWGAGRGVTPAPERGPWVVGWGSTSAGAGTPTMPHVAYDTNIQVLPDTSCPAYYWGPTFRSDLNLCAGGARTEEPAGSGSCNGDSGGPVVANANGAWRVVGVVSYGAKPCDPKQPAAYVKLAAYRSWLVQQGVPIGTTTVVEQLPAPALTGRGSVLPPGPPVTIETPDDAVTLAGFEASADMRWSLRPDQRSSELVIRRDGVEVLRTQMGGYIGYRLPVGRFSHGTYQWCVTTADDTSGVAGGEACRSFVRTADHVAGLRSVRVRGRRGSFRGTVVSTEPKVRVSVQVKVGRRVIARKTLSVSTRGAGVASPFSWSAPVPRGVRPTRLTARVVVDGGGAKRGFTNVLR